MLILDATTRSIQAVLAGAATTQPDYFATAVDIVSGTPSFTALQSNGTLNSTTPVTIVANAANNQTQRQIKFISIFNRDSGSQTVTVSYNDNGTLRTIYRGVLLANEMLEYVDGEGWTHLDANGVRRFTLATANTFALSFTSGGALLTATDIPQGSLFFQQMPVFTNFNPDVAEVMLCLSNSAGAGETVSINMGIYSFNGNTLSMASSTQRTLGYNGTAAASSYTAASGTKFWSIPTGTWAITPGAWVLAIGFSFTSSGTSGTQSYFFNRSNVSQNGFDFAGGAGNWSSPIAFGVYSAATNGCPGSVAWSQVNQTGAAAAAMTPWFNIARTS